MDAYHRASMSNVDASSSLRIPLIACAVALLLALLAVVGWTALLRGVEQSFDTLLLELRASEDLVTYVRHRTEDLDVRRARVVARLRALGVATTTRDAAPLSMRPCPLAPSGDLGPPGSMPWHVRRRVDAKRDVYAKLSARLDWAEAVHERLPPFDREVQALEARLRELEAKTPASPDDSARPIR